MNARRAQRDPFAITAEVIECGLEAGCDDADILTAEAFAALAEQGWSFVPTRALEKRPL